MLVIADVGINHNGDITTAKQLIHLAAMYGVDVVKFQKRNPDICVPESQKNIIKDTCFGRMSYIDYKHMIEFGKREYDEIDSYCKKIGIKWTASVWDDDSLKFINEYDIPFIKVPSAILSDYALLRKINATNRDIIMSTGMSTEKEIGIAENIMSRNLYGILHCTSSYPSVPIEINLRYMQELHKMYPKYLYGYSGHEIGYLPTIMAATLGAQVIERHITLDHDMIGSDHKASLNPAQLIGMMQDLRQINSILGVPEKVISESELKIKQKLRR